MAGRGSRFGPWIAGGVAAATVSAGLSSAFRLGDSFAFLESRRPIATRVEPKIGGGFLEYRLYNWPGDVRALMPVAARELERSGFRRVTDEPAIKAWKSPAGQIVEMQASRVHGRADGEHLKADSSYITVLVGNDLPDDLWSSVRTELSAMEP